MSVPSLTLTTSNNSLLYTISTSKLPKIIFPALMRTAAVKLSPIETGFSGTPVTLPISTSPTSGDKLQAKARVSFIDGDSTVVTVTRTSCSELPFSVTKPLVSFTEIFVVSSVLNVTRLYKVVFTELKRPRILKLSLNSTLMDSCNVALSLKPLSVKFGAKVNSTNVTVRGVGST